MKSIYLLISSTRDFPDGIFKSSEGGLCIHNGDSTKFMWNASTRRNIDHLNRVENYFDILKLERIPI